MKLLKYQINIPAQNYEAKKQLELQKSYLDGQLNYIVTTMKNEKLE